VSGEVVSRLSIWALRWLLLCALWLALADSRALPELVAAAVVGAIGATFAGAVLRPGRPRTLGALASLARTAPRAFVRPVYRLVTDSGIVTAALWRRMVRGQRVTGAFRAARHSPQPGARTAAARVVAEIWGSVAPNRYVVGIDDENSTILVHELIRTDEPLDPLERR
jgi:hypothetical protein